MPTVILPADELKKILRERRRCGGDRYDEVWDGVYVMSSLADNEHQKLGRKLTDVIERALGEPPDIELFHGTNVSDRPKDWRKNFRCPDVAVFLPGNPAEDRGSHWFGGPDFAVEVMSPNDRSREKFDFYAKVRVRELMLVDRHPWCLELYRREGDCWSLVGKSEPKNPIPLASTVLPVTFRLVSGMPRPRVEVTRTSDGQHWLA
jgi:Uma2 family endonuclease